MQQNTIRVLGDLRISKDVIETIVKTAALEINGVAGLAGISAMGKNVRSWLFKKQPLRPVTVQLCDDAAQINIYITVREGVSIPVLGRRVQEAVKEAVESMTGIRVERVHLHVTDMVFDSQDVIKREKQ